MPVNPWGMFVPPSKVCLLFKFLLPCLVLVAFLQPLALHASSKDPRFQYENPIRTDPIRDPQIINVLLAEIETVESFGDYLSPNRPGAKAST